MHGVPRSRSSQQRYHYDDRYQDAFREECDEFQVDERYPSLADPIPTMQRHYSSIGRGPPPRPRSSSMNPLAASTSQPRRSRSIHPRDVYDDFDDEESPEINNVQAMLAKFTLEHGRMMEQQLQQNRELLEQNRQIQARLANLESQPSSSAPSTDSERGRPANRATTTRGKKQFLRQRQRGVPLPQFTESDSEVESTAAVAVSAETQSDCEENAATTELAPAELTIIRTHVSKTFRRACGVAGKEWPEPGPIARTNPITGEELLTPFFDYPVTDPRNHQILRDIAKQADVVLKSSRPSKLSRTARWDLDFLLECAKKSFRNFKKDWNVAHNEDAAERARINDRTTRWSRRRETKVVHLHTQIEEYVKEHPDIPAKTVRNMIHEQHVSDEASGPEDGTGESQAAWDARMATAYDPRSRSTSRKQRPYLEVLGCPWRSNEQTAVSHELQTMFEAALTPKELAASHYNRVTNTGRQSKRIPMTSPFDFGICREWLEDQRNDPDLAPLLTDWATYGDPPGFASSDTTSNNGVGVETDLPHTQQVDPRFDFESLNT
ncbi:hypothetical protein C8R43DRAFT_697223 [Mycena crocata]|nr:hypothetical protein C8R43DRAFT_697223 [Mycena crocata]